MSLVKQFMFIEQEEQISNSTPGPGDIQPPHNTNLIIYTKFQNMKEFLLHLGASPRLMLGFMGVTAFLSMWISNTATTAMMVPIVQAILDQLHGHEDLTTSSSRGHGRMVAQNQEKHENHESQENQKNQENQENQENQKNQMNQETYPNDPERGAVILKIFFSFSDYCKQRRLKYAC